MLRMCLKMGIHLNNYWHEVDIFYLNVKVNGHHPNIEEQNYFSDIIRI